MLQDQHRRLARDARYLAEDEFVCHQVGKHRHADSWESFDDVSQVLCVRVHRNARLSHAAHDFAAFAWPATFSPAAINSSGRSNETSSRATDNRDNFPTKSPRL